MKMDDFLARVLDGKEFLLFDGAMGTMLQMCSLLLSSVLALLAPVMSRLIWARQVS